MAKIIYINPRKKAVMSFFIIISLVCLALYTYDRYETREVPAFAAEIKSGNLWNGFVKNIFGFMPVIQSDKRIVDKVLAQLAQTDITEPKSMLAQQIIAGHGKDEWYITEPEHEEIKIAVPKLEQETNQLSPVEKPAIGKPLVGIYSTHNAETYNLTDGVDKIEGKNAGVVKAATKLKEALEARGIGAVQDTTINDYPDWTKSYSNSLKCARKLIKDYPSIQILIDVHRDAMPSRENSISKIDGKNVAKISFIVGSDTRLQHPNWRKNWAYANFLAENMEEMYPGLLKTVRVQSGRYNQHINDHSILIEVGSTKNSLEEADRAMEMFADVLAKTIAKKE